MKGSKYSAKSIELRVTEVLLQISKWTWQRSVEYSYISLPNRSTLVLFASNHDFVSYLVQSLQQKNNWKRTVMAKDRFTESKCPIVHQHCVRLGITQSEMVDWQLRMQNQILHRAFYGTDSPVRECQPSSKSAERLEGSEVPAATPDDTDLTRTDDANISTTSPATPFYLEVAETSVTATNSFAGIQKKGTHPAVEKSSPEAQGNKIQTSTTTQEVHRFPASMDNPRLKRRYSQTLSPTTETMHASESKEPQHHDANGH